jgi:4-amino-4-deoxy-L-arabinose transferase-like glycosyltransferase|tara:strand:+ start:7881 stop:9257 length:1377 start_codon:yes stop_codon:yes gene_type:complete
MNNKIKENLGIILIIIFFVFIFSLHLNPDADLWWDSSVYINMGKYIYSSGEAGLYESSRPLIWPLILGFFWKLGLDVIFFGKLLVLLFGIGIIILTYLISYQLFNKKTALLSSLLLSFSPTFFLFNSIVFTGVPSTFFSMFGIYLFIQKNYSLSGLFFGTAFMTRFFQISVIIPIYLFFIYLICKKQSTLRKFLISISFFSLPIIPYLISNLILYNSLIHPFQLQAYMTKFTGWIFHQPFSFYFLNLIKENILLLFSILGIVFIFKNEKLNKFIIPFVFLFTFIPYNLALHKEMRLLLPVFPLLYILTSYGIIKSSNLFKNHKNIILLIIVLIGLVQITPQLRLNNYDDNLDVFYDFVKDNDIENIWISNPSFIAHKDTKADELIYYPLYNTKKMIELQSNIDQAKLVLINTCDILPCPPQESSCNQEHNNFINMLKEKMNVNHYEKLNDCEYYILTS